jgi:tRNA G46 methylase TrmB
VVKRKHQRKDVLTPVFIAGLADILAPGGSLTLVTDHRLYFERKTALLDSRLRLLRASEGLEGGITWFQRVWERHGLPSLRAEYAKCGCIRASDRRNNAGSITSRYTVRSLF